MDKDLLALVIRVTEAPALNCWPCSMYERTKSQGSRVHEMEMNMIDYEYSYSSSYSQPSLRFVLPLVLVCQRGSRAKMLEKKDGTLVVGGGGRK